MEINDKNLKKARKCQIKSIKKWEIYDKIIINLISIKQ